MEPWRGPFHLRDSTSYDFPHLLRTFELSSKGFSQLSRVRRTSPAILYFPRATIERAQRELYTSLRPLAEDFSRSAPAGRNDQTDVLRA
jgi:hypothetical protein